jgi:ribosomal protein S18 acetylase RimI-like enzyme
MTSLRRPMLDLSRTEIGKLVSEDLAGASRFSCGTSEEDEDLNSFLRDDALRLQERRIVNTFVAYHGEVGSSVLVGYVSLLADAIRLETREKKRLDLAHDDHPFVPAVKIARLAVDAAFGRRFRGTGEALMRFACGRALSVAELAGCRLVTLDAYPKSVGFYEKLGFKRSRSKEHAAKEHPSMWLDLFAPAPPAWLSGASGAVLAPAGSAEGPSDE